jgi:tubulin epsilon
MVLHSLGGGTGSGVGSYLVELLADEFPGVFRSDESTVVTSVALQGGAWSSSSI